MNKLIKLIVVMVTLTAGAAFAELGFVSGEWNGKAFTLVEIAEGTWKDSNGKIRGNSHVKMVLSGRVAGFSKVSGSMGTVDNGKFCNKGDRKLMREMIIRGINPTCAAIANYVTEAQAIANAAAIAQKNADDAAWAAEQLADKRELVRLTIIVTAAANAFRPVEAERNAAFATHRKNKEAYQALARSSGDWTHSNPLKAIADASFIIAKNLHVEMLRLERILIDANTPYVLFTGSREFYNKCNDGVC